MFGAVRRATQERRERLQLVQSALGNPARAIEPLAQRLDEKTERLGLAWQGFYDRRRARTSDAGGRLRHPRAIFCSLQHNDWRTRTIRSVMDGEKFLRAKPIGLRVWELFLGTYRARAVLGRGYALVHDAKWTCRY